MLSLQWLFFGIDADKKAAAKNDFIWDLKVKHMSLTHIFHGVQRETNVRFDGIGNNIAWNI